MPAYAAILVDDEHRPGHPGWADIRRAALAACVAAELAVAELSNAGNGDCGCLAMAAQIRDVLDSMAEMTRRIVFDEQVIEQEVERRLADRCLRVVKG